MPHFMNVLIPFINLLNIFFFLDSKMSIFEEYGAILNIYDKLNHFK